jgi:hypothetical protein
MAFKSLKNSSVITGSKSSKLWDQSTTLNDFQSISTVIVPSSGLNTITFSNIPQNFAHLQIRLTAQETVSGGGFDNMNIYFQSDNVTGNYAIHSISGDGSGAFAQATASRATGIIYNNMSTNANTFGVAIIDILDYTSTTKNKTVRSLAGSDFNGSGRVGLGSFLWMNSSTPISSITLVPQSSFTQYTHAALYGIKAAS